MSGLFGGRRVPAERAVPFPLAVDDKRLIPVVCLAVVAFRAVVLALPARAFFATALLLVVFLFAMILSLQCY
jgi:hypothetical protein